MDEAILQIGKLDAIDNNWSLEFVDMPDVVKQLGDILTEEMKKAMLTTNTWQRKELCEKFLETGEGNSKSFELITNLVEKNR